MEAAPVERMVPAQGAVCTSQLCVTPAGAQLVETCCSAIVHEEKCKELWTLVVSKKLTPEQYLAEIERLAGPVHDRDAKLAQVRQVLDPRRPGEPFPSPHPDDDHDEYDPDEDDAHTNPDGECGECNQAVAIGQLGQIGAFTPKNDEWLERASNMEISAEQYADLLMREAITDHRGKDIELIEAVQEALRGE